MSHEPYIRTIPGGDTAVLMVHGIVGTPRHFDGMLEAVPESWSVYNILLEGHGGSAEDFAKTSMTAWRDQVGGSLDKLCDKYEKVFIVSHSMGTLLTLEAALRHTDKVRGIMFLAVPLKIGVRLRVAAYSLQMVFGTVKPGSGAASMRSDCGVELTKKLWVYVGWIPRYIELFRQVRVCRSLLTKLDLPCMAIQSKRDELVSPGAVKYLAKNPKIEIHELECSGHFGYVPEELEFINSKLRELFEAERKFPS